MTTVCVDETGLVAADTQLTSDNYVLHACKLFRMPDGGVITGCGEWSLVYARIQWHLDGEDGDAPDIRTSEVLVVKPDKSIWIGTRDCPLYPLMDKSISIGCGRDIGRSCLSRGGSALEAVQEAVQLDHFTSYPIQTMQAMKAPRLEMPEAITHVAKRKR